MRIEFKLGRLVCLRHVFIYLGNTADERVYCFGCHNCGYRLYTETFEELMSIKHAIDDAQDNTFSSRRFLEVEAA